MVTLMSNPKPPLTPIFINYCGSFPIFSIGEAKFGIHVDNGGSISLHMFDKLTTEGCDLGHMTLSNFDK